MLKSSAMIVLGLVTLVAQSCRTCWDSVDPWMMAHQAPQSMEFSRQGYWSGLTFPSPGNLPDPRIEPRFPALQVDSLLLEPPGKPRLWDCLFLSSVVFSFVCFGTVLLLLSEVAQSCLTICDPMDCSLPGSSVHGILQARILKWVAISFCRGSSQVRDRTQVSCFVGRRFTIWATREVLQDV